MPTEVNPSRMGMNQAHPDSSGPGFSKLTYRVKYYHTRKGLNINGAFSLRTRSIEIRVSPVGPHSHVLQALIESTVLKVATRHQSRSSTGINKVVESDDSALRGWSVGPLG
jgi:hypothetical protein